MTERSGVQILPGASMRIIYAVAGEGYGHATRSKPVIEHLRKHHKVMVVAGGKAYAYLNRFFPTIWTASTFLVYDNNAVCAWRTVLLNLVRLPLYFFSFLKMFFLLLSWRPDVVISDFEPWSCYAALFARVPVVGLCNQGVLTCAKLAVPEHHFWDFFKARLVCRLILPFARLMIVPSFFFPELKKQACYVMPVMRKEVVALRPVVGSHVLVYQTSSSNRELLQAIRQCKGQDFVVYGFNKEIADGNIVFKRFSEASFLKDLASCKALIANGSFSVISEGLFLRKPVLSIPVRGQSEQFVNAHYLEKLGCGMVAHSSSVDVVRLFIRKIPLLRRNVQKFRRWNNKAVLEEIEGLVMKAVL